VRLIRAVMNLVASEITRRQFDLGAAVDEALTSDDRG
jgi:hypothetical protein